MKCVRPCPRQPPAGGKHSIATSPVLAMERLWSKEPVAVHVYST